MTRQRKVCIDCGNSLKYEPRLSNDRNNSIINNIIVYSCTNCLKTDNIVKLIKIKRHNVFSVLETTYLEIVEEKNEIKSKKKCIDCGKSLKYEPKLSNDKIPPNEFRTLIYSCPNCFNLFNVIRLFRISRRIDEYPLHTVYNEVQNKK